MSASAHRLFRAGVLAAGIVVTACGMALAQDVPAPAQPYMMMRELRQVQDRVARGDVEAVVKQRALVDQFARQFEQFDDEIWKDGRNARAVLAFVLSGGDPKVLRGLLLRGQPAGVDANLARGVHAFISLRKGEALDYFAGINPLELEPALAGQIALAQAELAARTSFEKALEKLAEARLLAPGTLIEEASLRRQVAILSTQKQFEAADKATEIYFRRFPKSAYAGALKRQVARFIADRPAIDDKAPARLLEIAIERLDRRDRFDMYSEIAKEGVQRGRRDVVNFAGGQALALADEGSPGRPRVQIFLQAMRVASLDAENAKETLEGLKSDSLVKEEAELIAAAQSIANEVNRVGTLTPSDKPEAEWPNELSTTFKHVELARQHLATADQLLAEAEKK